MAECQRSISSAEFSEWIAFWTYEAELQGGADEQEPDQDQLSAKIHAWATKHNASLAAQERKPQLERVK